MVVVEFEDVFVKYETYTGGVLALRGVTFSLDKSEAILIMGPSGSGKTTILKAILGLVQPMHGTVKVFGIEPKDEKRALEVRRKIGYLTQEGRMINELTVWENIVFYAKGRGRGLDDGRIRELAGELNIETILDKRPGQLSGGELKRAELLMVLSDDPDLLLLDEPTSMLDAENSEAVVSVLSALKGRVPMIITSHDPRLQKISNKTLEIIGGELKGARGGTASSSRGERVPVRRDESLHRPG
ncbi:ATP-binding cassette domain-containing protein [Thermococcus sp. AM4]|uniref:ATP-binding cassette domain-containing protein n=1 Tax=Thermococcus sp. (strain AM4) TaxID=246969 RepID=UPI00018709A4|nr:ATP-binding cassette domain-containing protein [Thermococcus sp. AM4]EEB73334.1 molybdate ABC transporter ATP-binding protein [Thermococcus sp. AM4]